MKIAQGDIVESKMNLNFSCARLIFYMIEKQYGSLVRSTHGLIENNGASTPVLFSPCRNLYFLAAESKSEISGPQGDHILLYLQSNLTMQ